MKSRLSTIVVAALAVTALTLTGCSASTPPAETPAASTSAAPAQTTAPTETEAPVQAEAPFRNAEADPALADADVPEGYVAYEQVEDEYGTYIRLALDPQNPNLTSTDKFETATFEEFGFTTEQAEEARDAALAYITQEFLDSTIMDTPNPDSQAWFDQTVAPYWSADQKNVSYVNGDKDPVTAGTVFAQYGPSPVIRTANQPRMFPTIELVTVAGYKSERNGSNLIWVDVDFTNTFTADRDVAAAASGRYTGGDGSDFLAQVGSEQNLSFIFAGGIGLGYDPTTGQFDASTGDYDIYESTTGVSLFPEE